MLWVNFLGVAVITIVLLIVLGFAVLAAVLWSRTRNLAWRLEDVEDAVRRLQAERSESGDAGRDSTAIRE
jgi:hypothetical protein